MKSTAALGTATRTVGKLFFALMLLLAAVAVGFGGTALFVYHQFGDVRRPAAQPVRSSVTDHRTPVQPAPGGTGDSSQTRRIAALPSDQPQYTYADNNGGQPSAPAKRARQTTSNVPAPLEMPSQAVDASDAASSLNDPESHYITDSRTGRVIGIDGSVGARREEEQERLQEMNTPPRAIAVQTLPPEVRTAAPVIEDGRPIYHGAPAPVVSTSGSQYVPIRKALPVVPGEVSAVASTFNAAEYMANGQDRPVLRAQAVVPTGARVVKTVRVYRLPDGSQAVTAD